MSDAYAMGTSSDMKRDYAKENLVHVQRPQKDLADATSGGHGCSCLIRKGRLWVASGSGPWRALLLNTKMEGVETG